MRCSQSRHGGWLVAALTLTSVLIASSGVAHAQVRVPFTCRDAEPEPGSRQRYFEELQSAALSLLSDNLAEVDRFERAYDADPRALEPGDPRLLVAREQLEGLRDLVRSRRALDEALEERYFVEQQAQAIEHEIGTVLRFALQSAPPDDWDPEAEIIDDLEPLEERGFVVVDGERTLDGTPVDLDDGRYYIDVEKDIRALLDSGCTEGSRLTQIAETVRRDTQRLEAMKREAELVAPILDVEVDEGIPLFGGATTIAELVDDDTVTFETYWDSMRVALAKVRVNIAEQMRRIRGMDVRDTKQLAVAPLVRAEVLRAHPELEDVDCIVRHEIGKEDLVYALLYGAGGLASVGVALFGAPELAPVLLTAISAAMTGVGIADTIRHYRRYREARQARFTGATMPGLVNEQVMQSYHRAFLSVLAFTVLDGIFTVTQAWKLLRWGNDNVPRVGRAKRIGREAAQELEPDELRAVLKGEGVSDDVLARLGRACW